MKNLAGVKNADRTIKDELERAGIEVIQVDPHLISKGEVPYTITGKLNAADLISGFDIEFHRAWYYWVVAGRVPLKLALQLYAHPEGKRTVRVSGHCGCPPPEDPWIDWICAPLRAVRPIALSSGTSRMSPIAAATTTTAAACECSSKRPLGTSGTPFITLYHIDSQAGLLLFTETLKGNFR